MKWTHRNPLFRLTAAFAVFAACILADAVIFTRGSSDPAVEEAVFAFALFALSLTAMLFGAVMAVVLKGLLGPIGHLVAELGGIAFGEHKKALDIADHAGLTALQRAINLLAGRWAETRAGFDQGVAEASRNAENQKARLAAIVNDLTEGVTVCNMKHEVVLYNQSALQLLHVAGELGLGRPLFRLLAKEPILHILDVLLHRPPDGPNNAPFVTATTDGRCLVQGRISLIRAQGQVSGYVLIFAEGGRLVEALARREALLLRAIEALEAARPDDPVLASLKSGHQALLGGWWPTTDLHSAGLFDVIGRRLDGTGIGVTMTGLPQWLHGEPHLLALAIETLLGRVAQDIGVKEFDLAAETDEGGTAIRLSWRGGAVDKALLPGWQAARLPGAGGGLSVAEVAAHHGGEGLRLTAGEDVSALMLAILPGREGQGSLDSRGDLAPRPEFFDFGLLSQQYTGSMGQVRLKDLTFIVLDSETTGLHPAQGDQVVSLAAVRIVNGRILTGESFNRLVNPGRPIPKESIFYHGITDEMVADKPPFPVVLRQFKAFAGDDVLVAHNAAFDLKFIRMRESESGVTFANPVLDTMLLSSFVDGSPENQSLDAIARRYGVTVTDRHTALGDALVTAVILLRLIEALEAKGIATLDDAMTTLDMTMELHERSKTVQ